MVSANTPRDSMGRIDAEKDSDHIDKICHAYYRVPYPDPNGGNDAATLPWFHAQECSEFMNAERWSLVTGEAITGELPPQFNGVTMIERGERELEQERTR
jgi:hypothetical protein